MRNSTMLDTIATSARLKMAGSSGICRKSTTWPTPKPGSRNSRSVRLPSSPPSSSPNSTAQAVERMRGAYQMTKPSTPTPTMEKIQVEPLPMEKAAPGVLDEVELEQLAEDLELLALVRGS